MTQQTKSKIQYAYELMQQGQLDQAKAICKELCQENRVDARVYFLIGSIYGQECEYGEAVKAFREALRLQPGNFITHRCLGKALAMSGEYEEAERYTREALKLQPRDHEATYQLTSILLHMGESNKAVQYFQQAIRLDPASDNALHALGDIYSHQKQHLLAIDYYSRALNIKPDRIDSGIYLGNSLLALGRTNQAIMQLEKVAKIEPHNVSTYTSLGHAYMYKGDPDMAATAFRKALSIDPDNLAAQIGEIILYERAGKLEAAHAGLMPLIQKGTLDSDVADVYVKLCRHFEDCSAAIEYANRVLERTESPSLSSKRLHYSLGNYFDRHGNFDTAFSHYQRANELESQHFDPIEHTLLIDALIKNFSWQYFTTTPRAAVRSSRPIFIIGMPRSGTTLTEQILSSHPEVFGAGELPDIGNLVQEIHGLPGQNLHYPYHFNAINQEMLDNMARRYLRHLEKLEPNVIRITDKMPTNFLHLGMIALAFPAARIIHCTRDPRDTCLSIYFQNFSDSQTWANNLEHLGIYYNHYAKLVRHFRGLMDIPVMEVRYEELVANQEEVTHRLIDFAGLEWDDRCLEFHTQDRFVATASYEQVRQSLYSSSVGRWKNYEKYLEPLLQTLDVELSGIS